MKRCKALLSILLVIILTAAVPAQVFAEDGYCGSRPTSGIYQLQTKKRTCTLIAATMMLRNCANLNGKSYNDIDEHSVGRKGWSDVGLSHDFTVEGMHVVVNNDIKKAEDKKEYLIQCLKKYKGGIVIYDTGAPHAIWLFGYDPDTDTFYCADTFTALGGKTITLAQSSIQGDTQQKKINTIDKIWHIA